MTHDIYNPWHGCRKISEGCQNCYVYFMDRMWERDASVVARTRTAFKYPLQRYRDGRYKIESGERIRVCMTSDFFIEDADPWRPEVWRMLRFRSDVIWMLLTKRADRIERCLPPDWDDGYENVQLGVTAENQRRADERVPTLLSIPARHRHVNAAPLVGPVNLTPYLATGLLEFVQAGGENYDGSRLCRHAWVASLRDQCAAADVDFTFYETGTRFEVGGVEYRIPRRRDQAEQAFLSGLRYYSPRRPTYRLYEPGTTDPVPPERLHARDLTNPHCPTCASQFVCDGCHHCGNRCC